MKRPFVVCVTAMLLVAGDLAAQFVKITPLGARTGEFCSPDRALIFEDPTGVRILYDPGTTVGGADTRLGRVDAILVSHAHSDHLGGSRMTQLPDDPNAGCQSATTVPTPNSNAAEIVARQKTAIIGSQDLSAFISAKVQGILGAGIPQCPGPPPANEMVIGSTSTPCVGTLSYGGKRTIRAAGAGKGVQIALVQALHGNALSPSLLNEPLANQLSANGLSFSPGAASGFVVTFTNGLRAYLSGDTGQTSDMSTVVKGYYGANLAVLNIGDVFTTGPEEAAFVINQLIQPVSVIPSHANEVATSGGTLLPNTKTARFAELVTASVYPPLSGVRIEFDGLGYCVIGCNGRSKPRSR